MKRIRVMAMENTKEARSFFEQSNRQAMLYFNNINPALSDIRYANNTISYGNVTIPLNDFDMQTLLGNYSSFLNDVKYMDAEDFLNIVSVHVLGKEQLREDCPTVRGAFYDVIDGMAIMYEPVKVLEGYNAMMYDLMCYQDYLTAEIKGLLDEFNFKMEMIATFESDYSDVCKEQLQKYYKMRDKAMEFALKFQSERERRLGLTIPREKAGYANAALVVVSTMMAGVLLACLAIMYIL